MWEVEIACWTLLAEFCHYPTSTQAPTSSYPGGLELSGRPRATPSSQRDLEVRRAHHPAGLEPIHNTPSLEFAAKSDGGCISAIPYRESPPPQGLEGHQRMGTT